MAAITASTPERKRSARLIALAFVLSWAFVFGIFIWLTAPPEAKLFPTPTILMLASLVILVLGAMAVIAIGDTISKLDEDHHGRKGLAGWIAAGLLGGLFSGLSALPFFQGNERWWAELTHDALIWLGPVVGYALAFRRNPITTFASLPSAETPNSAMRWFGGSLLAPGIIGLIIATWIVNGILTEPGFRAPWGMAATLPICLSAIAFGWTFYHYDKPFEREAVVIGALGLLFGLVGAVTAIVWLIWG